MTDPSPEITQSSHRFTTMALGAEPFALCLAERGAAEPSGSVLVSEPAQACVACRSWVALSSQQFDNRATRDRASNLTPGNNRRVGGRRVILDG